MHEPSATLVVEYAPAGDELGPEEAWRLTWWMSVFWSLGIVFSHGWPLLWAAEDWSLQRAQRGLWAVAQQAMWTMESLVAMALLAALLSRARRTILMLLAGAGLAFAFALHLTWVISRQLFGEPTLSESAYYVSFYTLSILRLYGGCFLLFGVLCRPQWFSARRLATVVALLLLVWPVHDALIVLNNLVQRNGTLLEMTQRHWIIYHIQAAALVAASLLALHGLRASPPFTPAIRIAGVLVLIGVMLEWVQYLLGHFGTGPNPLASIPARAGTLLAWVAPAAALLLWRQRGSH